MEQEKLNTLIRIYYETTNEVAKDAAISKLENEGFIINANGFVEKAELGLNMFEKCTEPVFDKVTDFDNGFAKVTNIHYLTPDNKVTQREYAKKIFEEVRYLGIDLKLSSELPENNISIDNNLDINFNPNFIVFEQDNKFGYKNKDGVVMINAKFDGANEFVNGYAKVGMKKDYGNGKYLIFWGLIDCFGDIVAPCIYNEIGNVHSGFAWYKEMSIVSYMHNNFSGNVLREYSVPKYGYLCKK